MPNSIESLRQKLENGEEELVPQEIADRLLSGDNPIRVWREYRGLSVETLARRALLPTSHLDEFEAEQKMPSSANLCRLAEVLQVDTSDLE